MRHTEDAQTVRQHSSLVQFVPLLIVECNCSNNSDVCVYDGSRGVGVCANCTGNTEGTNCQVCSNGYYKSGESCIGKRIRVEKDCKVSKALSD